MLDSASGSPSPEHLNEPAPASAAAPSRGARSARASVLLPLLVLAGCQAPYQLMHQDDVPTLRGGFLEVGVRADRREVLKQALSRFGLPDVRDVNLTCDEKKTPSDCEHIGDERIPTVFVAMIDGAAAECVYQVYQQDTAAISQQTVLNTIGYVLAGAGIASAVVSGPSTANVASAVLGAGTTGVASSQKAVPPLVEGSVKKIVEAATSYYPLMKARVRAPRSSSRNFTPEEREELNRHLLAAMWDVAGQGCPPGVLEARAWFNSDDDRDLPRRRGR